MADVETSTPLDATAVPPLPTPSALTQFFWDGANEGKLMILRCQSCGHYVHYPRPICNRCLGTDLAPEQVSGRGTIYSYTAVTQAFHPYFVDRLPYFLAVVELEEEPGLRMTTNIVDCSEDDLHVGKGVVVDFVDVGAGVTLPMFRLA